MPNLAYVPPGVTVEELTATSLTPLLAIPGSVCLVGLAQGFIQQTDMIQLVGTTPVTLPRVPANATMASGAIVSIFDVTNPALAPSGYVATTDYTFSASNHTITRVGSGAIPDGNYVYVTYQYTPADYFQPIRLNSMADIQNRFGNALDPTNNFINSPLSFAANLAFQNGASNVVLQPLFGLTGAQATASDNANPAVWANVYTTNLLSLQDINIIVPVVGQSQTGVTDNLEAQILGVTQDFIYQMATTEQIYMIGLFGEDSTTTLASDSTLISHALTLQAKYNGSVNEQLVLINTASFNVAVTQGNLAVGGQYMAAALAGMLAAQSPAATITRKVISGFASINDTRSKGQMNTDAANGLLVVMGQGQVVLVRHGLTLDTTSVARREINVVRAKHYLIESVQQSLDNQVIGKLVADANAATTVNNLVIGVLEDLRGLGYITTYANVASRITSIDPTAMEVTFDYQPAFVVNYINVAFTIDLTSQVLTVSADGSTS